jgi:negative elongation factor B
MIGTNIKLYDIVRTSLQKLFLRTKIVHYSSLRLLLLMAFHDLENNSVSKSDSIHIFVWTLDAASKERKLDVKKQREIEQFLDAHARDTDIINKHIPFVLADPNIVSILAKSCVLSLHKQVRLKRIIYFYSTEIEIHSKEQVSRERVTNLEIAFEVISCPISGT